MSIWSCLLSSLGSSVPFVRARSRRTAAPSHPLHPPRKADVRPRKFTHVSQRDSSLIHKHRWSDTKHLVLKFATVSWKSCFAKCTVGAAHIRSARCPPVPKFSAWCSCWLPRRSRYCCLLFIRGLRCVQTARPWSYGSLHSVAAAGTLLRVSPRGLQVNHMPLAHRAGMGPPWHLDTCKPAPHTLCDTTQMRWFPTDIVDVPDDWGRLPDNAFMRLVNRTQGCRSVESARDINEFDTHYDVSLYDTLDRTLDVVVFKKTSGEPPFIAWRSDSTPLYEYVFVAILSIYLVSCVSQNVIDMFTPAAEHKHVVRLADTVSLILVVAYWVYCYATGMQNLLMLRSDQVLAVHLLLHIVVAIVREPLYGPSRSHIPGVHISAAISCVALLAARVHFSFDNPSQLLSTFFAWRCFVKIIASHRCSAWDAVIVAFDAFILCSILGNASAPHFLNAVRCVTRAHGRAGRWAASMFSQRDSLRIQGHCWSQCEHGRACPPPPSISSDLSV